jgi:hypothetical protein
MRRIVVLCGCAAVCLLSFPAPALAWWDFIEELSGPGRFYGWDISMRLFCIAESKTERKPPAPAPAGQKAQPTTRTFALIPPPIGVITSACKAEGVETDAQGNVTTTRRKLAFDVGARFVWAVDNDAFATGHRISLTTLEPAVSVPLLNRFVNWDLLDYGVGAGVYWFSSTEFPSFNGAFLEPVRLDVHAPFNWRKHAWSSAIPRARFGLLVFPAGFERASFAPTDPSPARISRDWVKTVAIDFDLEPLLNYLSR